MMHQLWMYLAIKAGTVLRLLEAEAAIATHRASVLAMAILASPLPGAAMLARG